VVEEKVDGIVFGAGEAVACQLAHRLSLDVTVVADGEISAEEQPLTSIPPESETS
jgi:hypothetical protein